MWKTGIQQGILAFLASVDFVLNSTYSYALGIKLKFDDGFYQYTALSPNVPPISFSLK